MNNILKTHRLIKSKKQLKSPSKVKLYATTTKSLVNVQTVEDSDFQFKEREKFTIRTNFTRALENLCSYCDNNYIGRTSTSHKRKTTPHEEHIRFPGYRQITLSAHIERRAGYL